MNIKELINNDFVKAMKEKDTVALNTIRLVKGAVQLEVINKKEENDELYLDVISKQIKMRNDSIIEFKKGNRDDLVASNQAEIEVLAKYMPKQLSDEELNAIIDEVFETVKPSDIKDLGLVMKNITPIVKNKCDMAVLNRLIREKLN